MAECGVGIKGGVKAGVIDPAERGMVFLYDGVRVDFTLFCNFTSISNFCSSRIGSD
jgi:hypothetical protein